MSDVQEGHSDVDGKKVEEEIPSLPIANDSLPSHTAEKNQVTEAFDLCEGSKLDASLTAFDRIVISTIAIDFLQVGHSEEFKKHTQALSQEIRNALTARAGEIYEQSKEDANLAAIEEISESMWLGAVDKGIQRTLSDFLKASNSNYENLSRLISSQLSLKAQLSIAIVVAIAVSLFFASVKLLEPDEPLAITRSTHVEQGVKK